MQKYDSKKGQEITVILLTRALDHGKQIYTRTVCRQALFHMLSCDLVSEHHRQLSEGGGDGFSHFSYCSSLHLATDIVTTKVLANPGFGMKIDVRGLVPPSHT